MENTYVLILTLIAMVIAYFSTPLVKKIAFKTNTISVPKDERRIHKVPIPLLGGLAIYIAFVISFSIYAIFISHSFVHNLGLLIGSTIIVIGGCIDDKCTFKPWQKLIFQLVAATCVIVSGTTIANLTNPFSDSIPLLPLGFIGVPLTVIWIVGVTNAFNFIDGLDGLSAGVAFISCITISIIALLNQRYETAAIMLILSGSILGFLPHNFNPATIFMGDAGATLLGFLLAAVSIDGAVKSATAFAIAVPILALGLPIYDTLFAMIRRKVNGKPMSQGDRGHLHHRLLDMGLTQRQAVIIMYLFSAVLGAISIIAMQLSSTRAYFLLVGVLSVIVFIAWRVGFFKQNEK